MAIHNSLSLLFLGTVAVRPGKPSGLRRKGWALLAYLAATGQAHRRPKLAHLFCQEAADPVRTLRLLLSRIRRQLGPGLILTEADLVWFNPQAAWVDSREFERSLQGDLARQTREALEAALSLYRGEFLAGMTLKDAPEFELWLLGQRAHLRQLYERGLGEIVTRLTAGEAYEAAIERARQLLQSNPLLEEVHARLIWLYAHTGQREAALKQFEWCRQLLRQELAVEPMPELQAIHAEILVGRSSPAFTLTPSGPVATWRQTADFVGRETELAYLHDAWLAALAGRGQTVLLAAEAGGGKTRLAQAFGQSLPTGAFLVGRCYESTTALPYHPWIELLQNHLAQLDDISLARLAPFTVNYLARLLPGQTQRLKRLVAHSHTPPATGDGELTRLFTAVTDVLCLPAGEEKDNTSRLIFLDDLQWADETSLRLFHFIARYARQTRLLLVGAFRPEEVEDAPALRTLLHDLQQLPPRHLTLKPLSPSAIRDLAARLWPEEGPQLPEADWPRLVAMVDQATGGNALFVTEVLRELAHTTTTQLPAELPVPATVRELIGRRLGQLPSRSRQVIEAIAVFHAPITLTAAQQISGRSEDEAALALDWGLRRGLLQEQPQTQPAHYDFHHDLVREAVVEQLSRARRELLHRRAARYLEQAGAPADLLAYHWGLAGDKTSEGYYAALAGEQAAAVYAHDEAMRYFARALELLPETEKRITVMVQLADVWSLTGKWAAAETMYRQALSAAQKLADSRLQAQCQMSLGKLLSRQSRYQEALVWLEQARALCAALNDQAGIARNIGTMGIIHWQMDEYDRALACYQQALQIETALDNQTGVAIWVSNIAGIHDQRGEFEQALDGYHQALRIHLALGKKIEAGICLGNLGNVYRHLGDYRQAVVCYEQALQHRHAAGDEAGIAFVVRNMGALYAETGFFAPALACYRQVLPIHLRMSQKEETADVVGQIGDLYLAQGVYEQALACYNRSIPLLRLLGGKYYLCRHLLAKATALFHCGRYAEAQLLCQEGEAIIRDVNQALYFSTRLLSIRLAVALEQVSVPEAIEQLAWLRPEASDDKERAAIQYESWRLDKTQEVLRRQTAELYHALYTRTPTSIYRQRYKALTGQTLPAPSLPPLPALISGAPEADLEARLGQVDQLVKQMDTQMDTLPA